MGARGTAGIHAAIVIALLAAGAARAPDAGAATTARELQRATNLCDQGNKSLNAGNATRAEEQYRKALELVPPLPDAHIGLGNIRMKQARFQDALTEFERARDAFAEIGEAIFDLRVEHYQSVQHQLTEYRDGLRTLRTEAASDKADPALVQREITQVEDSIRRLEAVEMPVKGTAREAPGEVWFLIGNAQFRLGRFDDAAASWETCAARSPKFAQVQVNLAVAYWKKGRFDDARRALAKATELGFPVSPQMKSDLEKAASEAAPGQGAQPPAPVAGPPLSPPPSPKP